ncbi:MAG: D-alanine--D-alanine ligase [Thermodesulfobacteriota bacterium]
MSGRRIGILYNEPLPEGEPGWESSRDVLFQVDAVESSLQSLGHGAVRLPFAGRPADLLALLDAEKPDSVFNLCESVNEDPTLIGHPAAILELLSIPFTGSSAFSLMLSTDKAAGKFLMQGAGVRTPAFVLYDGPGSLKTVELAFPVIAKPRFQDASIGIDQGSVFRTRKELQDGAERLFAIHGPLVVEEFIAGRELNVSVLGYPALRVLAVAEIDFSAFPEGLHHIVGYRAKWEESTFEYANTPRVFPTSFSKTFIASLQRTVLHTCQLFQIRDYGRVDIRLDHAMRIFVLEANANPCLSPDAGFAAAALHNGISYRNLVGLLLACLDKRR